MNLKNKYNNHPITVIPAKLRQKIRNNRTFMEYPVDLREPTMALSLWRFNRPG
jgi:hypothetical protein